ncbi:TylF/MycF/NovP-related O-methyltransferase [Planctobacterium marinum]|uniref:Macrocin-O-methyltransferase (TylF) n=1 Tax=Planctobacterium marinum TaxID=1631968 RepID=A0AA48HM53_9ALTE|nr:hypothetical protein MACH26_33000 [Planctobacterium marinum]
MEPGNIVVWGTGDLCDQFMASNGSQLQVTFFVDSYKTGEKQGIPVIAPEILRDIDLSALYICSTWYNQIIPVCLKNGVKSEDIYVVMARTFEAIPLNQFERMANGEFYFLPWKKQLADIHRTLSCDIVHPDVYKDIAKSVSYCFISSVEGDFAEFGTCTGYTASLIAYAISFYAQRMQKHETAHHMQGRKLCLFDSFAGFPKATLDEDLNSPHVASGVWGEGTAKGLSALQLRQLVTQNLPEHNVNIYEGWYKDTLSDIPAGQRFAFVHMDCDLYESTIDVLRYLFSHEHLSEGAMLLFDNWYCNRASHKFAEHKAWLTLLEEFDVNFTDLGMYACVGNKMIIHDYLKK